MAAAQGPPQLLSASPPTFMSSWIVALSRQAGGTLIGGYTAKYDCSAFAAELRPRPRLRPITCVRSYVRTYVFLIRCPIAYTGLASASDSAIRTYAIRMYRRTYVRTCFSFCCLRLLTRLLPQKFSIEVRAKKAAYLQRYFNLRMYLHTRH